MKHLFVNAIVSLLVCFFSLQALASFTSPTSDSATGNYTVSWNYYGQGSCSGGSYSYPYRITEQKVGSTAITTRSLSSSSLNVSGKTKGSYVYKLWTHLCSSSGEGYYYRGSTTVNVLQPVPRAPAWTNLEGNDDNITLLWANMGDATKLQVFESKNDSAMILVHECHAGWECAVAGGAFKYTKKVDTGRYRYQVRGINSTGQGPFASSSAITLVVEGSSTPMVPTIADTSADPDDDPKSGEIYSGFLDGQHTVTSSGAFSYDIPVVVPPGINGLQPDISFSYSSSNSKNGVLGWGWGLKASSGIGRCPADFVRDGYRSGIMPGDSYKFCLDGQRLVEVADREYRTESESFSRIRSYGGTYEAPEYWVVEFKNGRKVRYGGNYAMLDGANDRRYWFIAQLEDAFGNKMEYQYSKGSLYSDTSVDADWMLLSHIRYSYGDDGQPANIVHFVYEGRPDIRTEYVGGRLSARHRRLKRIDVYVGGTRSLGYTVDYLQYDDVTLQTTAQMSRVGAIKKCARFDGINWRCIPTKKITWNNEKDEPGFESKRDREYYTHGDFDGDGKLEEISISKIGENYTVSVKKLTSQQWAVWLVTAQTLYKRPAIYDLDGDGLDDIVFESGGFSEFYKRSISFLKSTGSGFVYTTWAHPLEEISAIYGAIDSAAMKLMDMNGDGLKDIVFDTEERNIGIQVGINNGSGFETWVQWHAPEDGSYYGGGMYWRYADVNGDGLTDIINMVSAPRRVLINIGNRFREEEWDPEGVVMHHFYDAHVGIFDIDIWSADVNGDGLADLISTDSDGSVAVSLSTGHGFSEKKAWLNVVLESGNFHQVGIEYSSLESPSVVQQTSIYSWYNNFVDVNGDGCADLIRNRGGVKYVAYSSCTEIEGFKPFQRWAYDSDVDYSAPYSFGDDSILSSEGTFDHRLSRLNVRDINRDGTLEFLDQKYSHTAKQKTRLVVKIEDYEDASQASLAGPASLILDIEYDQANASSVQATAPAIESLLAPRNGSHFSARNTYMPHGQIVKSVTKRRFSGQPYGQLTTDFRQLEKKEYKYKGYAVNTQGWGGLGFSEIEEKTTFGYSSKDFLRKVTRYSQQVSNDARLVGIPINEKLYVGFSTVYETKVSDTSYQWKVRVYDDDIDRNVEGRSSPHYFPYKIKTTTQKYDVKSGLRYAVVTDQAYEGAGCTTCSYVTKTTVDSEFTANGAQKVRQEIVQDVGTVTTTIINSDFQDRLNSSSWILGLPGTVTKTASTDATDTQVRVRAYTYTDTGQVDTETVEPNNPLLYVKTTYSYNSYGTRNSQMLEWNSATNDGLAYGNSKSSSLVETRSSDGSRILVTTDFEGHETTSAFSSLTGRLTSLVDANGRVTSTQYDIGGRVISETLPGNIVTTTDYRRCSNCFSYNVQAEWYAAVKTTGASSVRVFYDAQDREVGTRTKDLKGRYVYTYKTYDHRGRLVNGSSPFYVGESPQVVIYTYDILGRVDTISYPDNSEDTYVYSGLLTDFTNREGQTSSKLTNDLGWVLETADDHLTSVTFSYWPFGDVKSTIVDDDAQTQINIYYDGLGRKTKQEDPDAGETLYTHNSLGLLASETNANGYVTSFGYDRLDRVVAKTDDALGDAKRHTWVYDNKPHGVGALGSIIGEDTDGDEYSEDFEYNEHGLLRTHIKTIKGRTYTSTSHYDRFSRSLGFTYPSGFTVKNVRNSYGYLDTIQSQGNSKILWQARDTNAFGSIKEYVLGNGVVTNKTFDPHTGRIATIRANKNGYLNIQNQSFEFSPLGNLERKQDHLANTDESYCYDTMNRLLECSDLSLNEYDVLGNISKKGGKAYEYDSPRPHAVTNALGYTYHYDNAGQMTSGGNRTIRYTSFGKPNFIRRDNNEVHIAYGPDQSRVTSYDTHTDTRTTYVNLTNYEVIKTDTSIKRVHYIGDFAQFVSETGVDNVDSPDEYYVYLHRDHQGSIVAESDDNLTTSAGIEWLGFDAWGKVTMGLGNTTLRGYTNHEHLSTVGLVHMNGRVFDPDLARFLTPDPLIQAPFFTQSYNRYSYVFNNPMSLTDPSGYQAIEEVVVTFEPPLYIFDLTPSLSFDGLLNTTISMPALEASNAVATNLAGSSGNAAMDEGIPINATERAALEGEDLQTYYQSRHDRGDPYGAIGLSFWGTFSPNASFAKLAAYSKINLSFGILKSGMVPADATKFQIDAALAKIGLDLAIRHAYAVTQDYLDNVGRVRGVLGVDQITDFHHESFKSFNVENYYYGGTPVLGMSYEAHIVMPMFGLSRGFD